MKAMRQKLRNVGHHSLRWFLRLRVLLVLGYILGFTTYELYRYYHLKCLTELPGALRQSSADTWDEFWGRNYLEKEKGELKLQADGGNSFAQYVYARRHTQRVPAGAMIEDNKGVAHDYMRKAADGGNARACAVMAIWYNRGEFAADSQPTESDLKKAKVFADKSIKQGDATGLRIFAELRLAEAAKEADGKKRKELEQEAYGHLQRAADRGNLAACRLLGDVLVEGKLGYVNLEGEEILVQNYTLALQYYRRAALGRDQEACLKLAQAYDQGVIVSRDQTNAYAWYLVAGQLPVPRLSPLRGTTVPAPLPVPAKELIELRPCLSAEEATTAQNLARDLLLRIPSEREATINSILESR